MVLKTLGVAVALFSSTSAFATTIVSNGVAVGTRVNVGAVLDEDNQTSPLNGIGTVTAATTSTADGATVNASTTGTWLTADAGTIGLSWGWESDTSTTTILETNRNLPNWTYTFVATDNGTFNLSGTVVATGTSVFGLQPIYLGGDFGFGTIGGTISNPNGTSSVSVTLVDGLQYTFSVYNFGNLSADTTTGLISQATADLQWSITYNGVPEPMTWAMMIGGFGAVGAAQRRRRASVSVLFA